MNRSEFRKNIGRTLQFVPLPRRDDPDTGSWESDMNLWILTGETADKKGFIFLNALHDHDPLILETAQIRHFDAPDKLVLRGHHPRPASGTLPKTTLQLYISGADEDGLAVFTNPPLDQIQFIVVNEGEQTVRDYRNIVLVPEAFTRTTSASYLGNLSKTDEITIGEQNYTVYGTLISQPIFKKERVRIGALALKADPGDYTFLWRVRCDDGTFPAENEYGQLRVRIIPFGSLVDEAHKTLFKKQ
ncbi:MAG TPA: hypothetical protein VLA99_15700 [Nitrospiraceae bacterium]|nr:hypothetical protein [Nitrospiraceae bacterium]